MEETLRGVVAPVWERGLKYPVTFPATVGTSVAPVWERGLKLIPFPAALLFLSRRSRLGAWIEINDTYNANQFMK